MASDRTRYSGRYHSGELDVVITAPGADTENTELAVVAHGTAADASFFLNPGNYTDLEAVAARGITVVAADLGNPLLPDGWGNDTSIARLTEVISWAGSFLGCTTTRVGLIGDSAGAATVLGWAWRNPSQVGAVSVRGAVTDIQQLYAINSLVETLVNNAYGGAAAWTAARATHDPILNTASLVTLKDRIRVYYSDGDTLVVPASQVTPFTTAVGCRAVPVGGAGVDHGAVVANLQGRDQAQWIAGLLAA
ncbi:MAG TPA: hypothetical protein VFV36_09790 [Candidatus Methylomirabilis sp.]|nr:hypothetical protein [Candidatus Methylomirabilis sp.]